MAKPAQGCARKKLRFDGKEESAYTSSSSSSSLCPAVRPHRIRLIGRRLSIEDECTVRRPTSSQAPFTRNGLQADSFSVVDIVVVNIFDASLPPPPPLSSFFSPVCSRMPLRLALFALENFCLFVTHNVGALPARSNVRHRRRRSRLPIAMLLSCRDGTIMDRLRTERPSTRRNKRYREIDSLPAQPRFTCIFICLSFFPDIRRRRSHTIHLTLSNRIGEPTANVSGKIRVIQNRASKYRSRRGTTIIYPDFEKRVIRAPRLTSQCRSEKDPLDLRMPKFSSRTKWKYIPSTSATDLEIESRGIIINSFHMLI